MFNNPHFSRFFDAFSEHHRRHGHGHPHGHAHGGFEARFGGRMGGFGPFGGGGLRRGKFLSSEALQLVVLHLLAEKPHHGYEIIKAVEALSSGVYAPSPGMIYPALTYLEEIAFATCAAEGAKKLYSITDAGRAHLAENEKRVAVIIGDLKHYGQRVAWFEDEMAREEAVEERWGGSPRQQEKQEWRRVKAELHDLRHELKAALFEKLGASLEEKERVLAVLRKAIEEIRGK